jgi:hypothetical protein
MHGLPEHLAKLLPERYTNDPREVVYRYDVDPSLIVTFVRITGLCWDSDRTPALKPDDLALLLGLPRRTMYRHLKKLKDDDEGGENPGCLRWIEITQVGRQIIIRPLIRVSDDGLKLEAPSLNTSPAAAGEPANAELRQALLEIGVENPKRDQLTQLDIDPLWVYAWDLWAEHPHRHTLTNPVGNIILKLEAGEKPPNRFLKEAERWLQEQRWLEKQALAQARHSAEAEHIIESEPREEDSVPPEIHQLWTNILSELQLQMTHATYDIWLRGSQVIAAEDDHLTVAVRYTYAVDWLENRLMPVIQRTVTRHTGRETTITFTAR